MWTFCFLLPVLLYSVGIDTRDARVVCYVVRGNTRIAIRGARDNTRIVIRGDRDNTRIAIRGARDNARSSIRGARENTRSSIGGARGDARSSIRVAVDGVSLQGSTLHHLRVRIGCMVFVKGHVNPKNAILGTT